MKKSILMKSIISIFLFAGMMVISPIHINAAEGDILIDYPDEFIHVETNKKVYFGKFKDEAAANKAFEAGKVTDFVISDDPFSQDDDDVRYASFDISDMIETKETYIGIRIGTTGKPTGVTLPARAKIKNAVNITSSTLAVELKSGMIVSGCGVSASKINTPNTIIPFEQLEIKKGKYGRWLSLEDVMGMWVLYAETSEDAQKGIIQRSQKTGATLYLRVAPVLTIDKDGKEVGSPASAEVKIKIAKLKKGSSIKVNVTDKNLKNMEGASIKFGKLVQWRIFNETQIQDKAVWYNIDSKASATGSNNTGSRTLAQLSQGNNSKSIADYLYGINGVESKDMELEFRTGSDNDKKKPVSKITTVMIPKAVHIAGIASGKGVSAPVFATNTSITADKALITIEYGSENKGKFPVTIKYNVNNDALKTQGTASRTISYKLKGSTKWNKLKASGTTIKIETAKLEDVNEIDFRIDGLEASKKTGNVIYVASPSVNINTKFTTTSTVK